MHTIPLQRLSFKDKSKDDYQWVKDCIDYFTYNYIDSDTVNSATKTEWERKLSNYQLYNNILNQQDFERECNPLGLSVGQYQDEIQPYNKIYNKIQVLIGEELSRPFKFRAYLINEDGIKAKLAYQDELLKEYIISKLSKHFPDIQNSNALDPAEIKKYMATTYQEAREITANKLLRYLRQHLDLKTSKADGFKHALIAGEEFLWIGTEGGQPTLKVLNPLSVFYHKSPDTKYVQDGLYAGTKQYLSPHEIIDRFGQFMTKDQIKSIEEGYYYNSDIFQSLYRDDIPPGQYSSSNSSNIQVIHLEWRSYRKVGFLTQIDPETLTTHETLVDEEFPLPANASTQKVKGPYNSSRTMYTWENSQLYWDWVPEVWQGVRIGNEIYVMMGPKESQFRSEGNPYDVKLGYHGLVYSNTNAPSTSLVDRMKPFQYLYFVIVHRMKRLIAQDRGKILHFDTTMIDPKIGLEKSMYYIEQLGIDFFNPLQSALEPGAFQRGKVTQATDASTAALINNYMNLLIAIDEQISDTAGVTRQREGQISNSEAVTNARQNIQQSSTITELYFYAHEKLWEQALSSLLQVAQVAYRDNPATLQYILDDLSIETLTITPENLTNADMGVFVGNSLKEEAVFKAIQDMALTMANAGKVKVSDLIKMLKSDSIEQLERDLKLSEEQIEQMQAQQSQSEAQMQQTSLQHEWDMQTRELETKIQIAQIDSFKFLNDNDSDNNQVPDQLEIAKFVHQVNVDEEKLKIERRKAISKPKKV